MSNRIKTWPAHTSSLPFNACMRTAFFAGMGFEHLDRVTEDAQNRWADWKPKQTPMFLRMNQLIEDHAQLLEGIKAINETETREECAKALASLIALAESITNRNEGTQS